jgi:putative tributyrin esterase
MAKHQIRSLLHNSAILRRKNKRLFALVPERAAGEPLPICYYLHGWGGTAEAYLNHAQILDTLGHVEQVSVFAESFRNWFINDYQGNRYEDYLVQEVLPAAEAEWLPHGCTSRMIAGFSMGGLSALCLTWRHPQLFNGVACFAGAFEAPRRIGDPYAQFHDRADLLMPTERDVIRVWGEPGSAVRREYDPYESLSVEGLRGKCIYLAIGTRDFERIIDMNRRLHTHLIDAELPHKYEEHPHGHDMDIVASSLPSALDYLLKSNRRCG